MNRMDVRILLVLMLIAPSATAIELNLSEPERLIKPLVAGETVRASVSGDCTELLQISDPSTSTTAGEFLFEPLPAGILITGPMQFQISSAACQGNPTGTFSHSAEFTVAATLETPGLEALPLQATVRLASHNPASPADRTASASTPVTVEYLGRSQLDVASKVLVGEPGDTLTYEVTLTNLGNAATVFTFVGREDDGITTYPPPTTLPRATANQSSSATVEVTVSVPSSPGWNNDQHAITADVFTHAEADPTKSGLTLTVSLLASSRGFATVGDDPVTIPTAGPMLLLVALGALVARRRA